ncbi:serine carboxypeptidase S28-domain-containing protein [Mycena rosella]|uniref:Serine carboxypeptidase S28-domain-containing protein n=1 Tax=Mycena rosella TaxID=1033263 RepID=A0AAD7CWX5_MYCRO|nr:serine carboxypeptidase S28-domain-containing protein [Mycena rosella]
MHEPVYLAYQLPPEIVVFSFSLIAYGTPTSDSSTLSGLTSISSFTTARSIDGSASIFAQRVQVNNTFYKPGEFVCATGGSSPPNKAMNLPRWRVRSVAPSDDRGFILNTMQEDFEFARWAPEFGAALMVIENRYFGESLPYGNNSYTTENVRFLALDNDMADAVATVDWWRTNVTNGEGKDSPAVVFGGSYSASLATIFRINHPETFFGAVASAGPVRAFLPVTDDPDRYNRYNLVPQYWMNRAPDAAMKVKEGFKQLQEMVDADAICSSCLVTPLTTSQATRAVLRRPSRDPIGVEAMPFAYFQCRYFDYDPGDVAPATIFAATAPYGSTPYSQQSFNLTPLTRTELFAKYHFDEATIRKTTRVIYSQGGADLVRGIGRAIILIPMVPAAPDESWFQLAPTDPNAPRFVYADYATHTQDLLTSLIPGNYDPSLFDCLGASLDNQTLRHLVKNLCILVGPNSTAQEVRTSTKPIRVMRCTPCHHGIKRFRVSHPGMFRLID